MVAPSCRLRTLDPLIFPSPNANVLRRILVTSSALSLVLSLALTLVPGPAQTCYPAGRAPHQATSLL